MSNGLSCLAAYGIAALFGLLVVLSVFPAWALLGHVPAFIAGPTDFQQHVVGQRYFLQQHWSWPLLIARRLDAATGGTNIALTDSIPLLAVLTKLLQPVLPGLQQSISVYQAAAWLAQPVAAVFVVRSAGERRLGPALAGAVIAISMPAFLARLWHAALDGHCFLLIELGCVLRALRGGRAAHGVATVLPVLLLLVHPYLMLMAFILSLAVPLTLAARRDRTALSAVAMASVGAAAIVMLAHLFGYWGAESTGGYGLYAMNLASPFWPGGSALLPGISEAPVDATGLSSGDAYQYLGAGVLLLLATVAIGRAGAGAAAVRRHPGLLVSCVVLTAIAASNRVYFFHVPVLLTRMPIHALEQARSSGRFFWPCSYVLALGALVLVARLPRLGMPIVAAAAMLQFLDAATWRRIDRDTYRLRSTSFDTARLAAVFRRAQDLDVLPTAACANDNRDLMQILWLAAAADLRTNTMYVARTTDEPNCIEPASLGRGTSPGTVRLLLPGRQGAIVAAMAGGARDCRTLAPFVACTNDAVGLEALSPPPPAPMLPAGRWLPTGAGDPANEVLPGWWRPMGPVAQTHGPRAWVVFRVPPDLARSASGICLTMRLHAPALPSGTAGRTVVVTDGAQRLAQWIVGAAVEPFDVAIPPSLIDANSTVRLRFDIARPARISWEDPRVYGVESSELRVDTAPGTSGTYPECRPAFHLEPVAP